MAELYDGAGLIELVKKYDRPGPRYTSYPTVPEWSDTFGPAQYGEALALAALQVDEPVSFYLHIPYCRKRCWFCGCNTMVSNSSERAGEYLARVEKELEMVKAALGKRDKISQFHWGGGTPSFLTDEQTIKAYEMFSKRFTFLPDAEISIELDPRVTSAERVALLKKLGFNRLSMGVQDFNDDVQGAIGRNQTEAETEALYRSCREQGYTGINFDLIYGLPKQTPESFGATIKQVIALKPDRVAMYSYAHLPQGKAHQLMIDVTALPTPEVKFELFHLARRLFAEGGYMQIGMDHFVLPTDELAKAAVKGKLRRNFMGYTVVASRDWIGVGMSSISFINNSFAQNFNGLTGYNEAIDNGRLATNKGMKLSADDLVRQHVISELMCNFRLDLSEVSSRYYINTDEYFREEFQRLQPLVDDGLVVKDNNLITITEIGRIFVRNIAMIFDAYLKEDRRKDSKVQFSRTI